MRGKGVAAALLLAGIFLTGCGSEDIVVEKMKEQAPGQQYGTAQQLEKALFNLSEESKISANTPSQKWILLDSKERQMREMLKEIKENKVFDGKWLSTMDQEEKDQFVAENGIIMYEEGISDWLEGFKENKVSYGNRTIQFTDPPAEWFTGSEKREEMGAVLEQFEKMGYRNLTSLYENRDKAENCLLVRNGAVFRLGFSQERENVLFFMVCFLNGSLSAPERYQSFLEENIKDGFVVKDISTGGFVDQIRLEGSKNEPGNPYDKTIFLYFRDGILQMEVSIGENGQKAEGRVFTEEEQGTVQALLASMTGDANGAAALVANFRLNEETEGTLGDRSWQLLDKGKGRYILRVQ